jgi:hypothetical protein
VRAASGIPNASQSALARRNPVIPAQRIYERRKLSDLNACIDEVLSGKTKARIVLEVR